MNCVQREKNTTTRLSKFLLTLVGFTLLASGCRTPPPPTINFTLPPQVQVLEVGVTNMVYIAPRPGVVSAFAVDNLGLLYLLGLPYKR